MIETDTEKEERSSAPSDHFRPALSRWIQILLLALVFAAGGAAGSVLTARTIFSRMETYRQDAAVFSNDITLRLRARLRLDDDQAMLIQNILERRHSRMIDHRNEGSRLLHTEFDGMVAEVETVLENAQLERWREISNSVRTTFLPTLVQ